MSEVARHILLDVFLVSLISLGVGLPVFRFLAKRGTTFHTSGKVWVEPFNKTDLIVCFLLIAFVFKVFWGKGPSIPNIDPNVITASIWLDIILKTFIIGLLMISLGVIRQINLTKLFGWVPKRWWHLLWIVPLVSIISVVGVQMTSLYMKDHVLSGLLGDNPTQDPVKLFLKSADHPAMRFSMIISACFVAPVVEEIVFRGYLYGVLKRFGEKYFAAIISSVIFSLMHANLLALVPLVLLALVLAAIYEYTGSLWAPIGVHALFNGTSVYAMMSQL